MMKYSALIGNPVEHSISPELFYEISKKINIEYAHLKIRVDSKDNLSDMIKSMINLGFCGFNVTCPYKLDVYDLLNDDELDDEVKGIKSVNSVVIRDGRLMGYNTDGKAAIMSIQKYYEISDKDYVVIIGAGGAAYSVLYEILKYTDNVVVFNEYVDKAQEMCNCINNSVKCYDLYDDEKLLEELKRATIVINATSVGMYPDVDSSLVSEELFSKISDSKKCFFDVIFNPWETKFIECAKRYGHLTVSGGYMLIYQAYLVMKLWLGIEFELSDDDIDELVIKMQEVLKNDYS